jgi:hypothetical protein
MLKLPLSFVSLALALRMTFKTHAPIYFSNIDIQQLQHTSETFKTLETYCCNMRFSLFFVHTMKHRAGKRPIMKICILATVIVAAAGGVTLTRSRMHRCGRPSPREAADQAPWRERGRLICRCFYRELQPERYGSRWGQDAEWKPHISR